MQNQFTTKNQSVDKVFTIIEYMAEMRMPMKLLEISRGVSFPSSTVLRLLTSLIERGYVYQDKNTLKYSLTLKFCSIADSVESSINVAEIVHPYLLDISNRSGETAYFAIEQDMMLVYLDAIGGNNIKNTNLKRIGHIAPLHAAGIGKLLLLNYDDSRIARLINDKGLERFTDNTVCTYDELKHELENVRSRGYAIDDEECEQGIRCIAMPLKDYTGSTIGGISISGSVNRLPEEKFDEFLEILRPVAQEISAKLGYSEPAVGE